MTKNALEYLGVWENLKNESFNYPEFEVIKNDSGVNRFIMSVGTMDWANWCVWDDRHKLEWNLQRTLAKINYHVHTDSIKENLIPEEITSNQSSFIYANEADILNVALFGITAKEWREVNPNKKGNVRDSATLDQLVVLSNMESINALLIRQNLSQKERLIELNKVAITQMKSLIKHNTLKRLK